MLMFLDELILDCLPDVVLAVVEVAVDVDRILLSSYEHRKLVGQDAASRNKSNLGGSAP